MKSIFFIITIAILLNFNSLASIIINESGNGLRINVSHLDFKLTEYNPSNYIVTINDEDAFFPSSHNFSLGDIRFQIAIPENEELNFDFDIIKLKSIGFYNIINLSNLDSNYLNFKEDLEILQPKVKIEKIGILRGLHIALVSIQPFYYNTKTKELAIIDSAFINIKFPDFQKKEINIKDLDLSFFSSIKNQGHIIYFYSPIQLTATKEKSDILQKTDWYNPQKKYVRLVTKSDGIAFAKASDIIQIEPFFDNIPLKNLVLWSGGQEKRLFISDNGNNFLDNDDIIYFLGSRAKGDTTWFENYTGEASFFLTYDDKAEGKRFDKAPIISTGNQQNYVYINRHIEVEKKYHRGFPQDNVEIVPGEGWFWEILEPLKGPLTSKTFSTNFELYPFQSTNDTIQIELNYKSSLYDITVDTNKFKASHLLSIALNNELISLDSLKRKEVRKFKIKKQSNSVIQGLNNLLIESIGIKKNSQDYLTDQIGFDFIEIEGKFEPVFLDNGTPFFIPISNENVSLDVSGFSSKNVFAIDTINGFIYQPETISGSFVRLGTKKDSKTFSSLLVNDTSIVLNDNGFSIAYLEPPNYGTLIARHFQIYSLEIDNFINSIPSQSIVFMLFNGFKDNNDLPQSLKNSISSLGSNLVRNLSKSDSWGLIMQKGKPETLKERLTSSSILTFTNFIEHNGGQSYKAKFNLLKGLEHNLFLTDDKKIIRANVFRVNQTYLQNKSNKAELLIITHPDFLETANKLKDYREKKDSNLKALLIDVNDIYKEFYFGKKSPHAIKEFLKYAYFKWDKPKIKYITFIGDACWDTRKLQTSTINRDFIPTYGWPASDYWYGLLEGDDLLSELIIGRIPITSNLQGLKYVEKVIDYENVPNDRWMKRFLLMSGGTNENERSAWYSIMKYTFAEDLLMKSPALCADTIIINKKDPKIGGEGEATKIISEINKGADWIAFLGHGSPVVLDMDGWQADKLNNKGRYGFFSTLSCNTSAFAEPDITSRNEDYVLASDRGFVGAGGSSNLADQFVSISLHLKMLQTISNPGNNLLTYPEILNNARIRMIYGELERFLVLQYTYLGDPMIKLRMIGQSDMYINPGTIKATSKSGNTQISETDSLIIITGTLDNLGYKQNYPFRLVLANYYQNQLDTLITIFYNGICYPSNFHFSLKITDKPGKHSIIIIADPDRITNDKNYDNNFITINQEVFSSGLYPLEPLAFWNVNEKNHEFRFINPLADKFKFSYDFKIFENIYYGSDFIIDSLIISSSPNEITEEEGYIKWNSIADLRPDKLYYVYALNKREGDTNRSSPLYLPFYIAQKNSKEKVHYKIWRKELDNLNLENLVYNFKTQSLNLDKRKIPVEIIGIRGNEHVLRSAEILFDYEYVLTTPPVKRGFNIVTFNENDPSIRKIRWFETWDDINTITNENSERLVRFLRDTVQTDEYVAIATCDESMQVPIEHKKWKPGSIGSIDTLKAVLKEFGSLLADSLNWGVSFAMLGKKGFNLGEAFEDIDYNGDTARVFTHINYYPQSAKIKFPAIVGFKKINSIKIQGDLDSALVQTELTLKGQTSLNPDSIIFNVKNINNIDLSSFNTESFSKISPILSLNKIEKDYNPVINSLEVVFEPAPELFLSKTNSKIVKNNILRGDTATISLTVKNISPRAKSDSTIARIFAISQMIYADTISLTTHNPDDTKTYTFSVPTLSLTSPTSIDLKINDPLLINELYSFNNGITETLFITEDFEKPVIKLFLDDIEIKSGDFTSIQPRVKVQLFDNSLLQIINPAKLWVRINGKAYYEFNARDYKFQSFGYQKGLKAELSFIPDSFEYKQNNINIYFEDAAGNKDTTFYKVFVSQNGNIEDIIVYPNPSKDYVNFSIFFKSPYQGGIATFDIFNVNGQKIKSIDLPVRIGKNVLRWDLFDSINNKIPVGVYFFTIVVRSDIYVEPQTGIFFRTE